MFKIAAPAALLSAEKPHHPTRRTDTLSEPECGPRMAFERQAVLFYKPTRVESGFKKRSRTVPCPLIASGELLHFSASETRRRTI